MKQVNVLSNCWLAPFVRVKMRAIVLLCVVLLSACGSASSGDQATARTAVAPQVPMNAAPIATQVTTEEVTATTPTLEPAQEVTATAEVSTTATTEQEATSTGSEDVDVAPVTTIMEQLGVAGEPFAAIGDPNAPITVIDFSDYG